MKTQIFHHAKIYTSKNPLKQTKILQYIIMREVFFQGEGVKLVQDLLKVQYLVDCMRYY